MNIEDIVRIDFDAQDIAAAEKWADFMDKKNQGRKTVDLSATKNLTGYLGHLAAERVFDNLGFAYQTTRDVPYTGGDQFDITYELDHIDVKSFRRRHSDKWFFNEKMVVMDHHQRKAENYFCFCLVDPDFVCAHVYGFIHAKRFWEMAQPHTIAPRGRVAITTHAHQVPARYLLSPRAYILRLWRLDKFANHYRHR